MNTSITDALSELVSPVELRPITGKELGLNLNLGMRNSYEFYRACFERKSQELGVIVVKVLMPVDQIERQYRRLESESSVPLLLVFEELKARERQRLARRKVPFMVPGKFLFAPMLGFVGETPLLDGSWNKSVSKVQLSPWAETILIKRLLSDLSDLGSGVDFAKHFDVSSMTISRALGELENFDLCFLEKHGSAKKVRFESKERLWVKASKLLSSPVVGTVELAELPVKLPMSGDLAMEHYTMLVGLPPATYAIDKREFSKLKKARVVTPPKFGDEKLRLELWRRDPKVLAVDGYVDPISLYFSVKNSSDERVRSESRKMIMGLGLEVKEDD